MTEFVCERIFIVKDFLAEFKIQTLFLWSFVVSCLCSMNNNDNNNKKGLICGRDNCQGTGFDDTDDCCMLSDGGEKNYNHSIMIPSFRAVGLIV